MFTMFSEGKFTVIDDVKVLGRVYKNGESYAPSEVLPEQGWSKASQHGSEFETLIEIWVRAETAADVTTNCEYVVTLSTEGWASEVYCPTYADFCALMLRMGSWFTLTKIERVIECVEDSVDCALDKDDSELTRFFQTALGRRKRVYD